MPTSKFLSLLSLPFSLLFLLGTHAQVLNSPTNITSGFNSTNVTTGFVNFPNGPKQVSWLYIQNDELVAYDGDVIFGTVAEFNQALINVTYTSDGGEPRGVSKRHSYPPSRDSIVARSDSVFPFSSRLWPNGQVFYRYFDDDTENQLSSAVEAAKNTWHDAVPCLTFTKVSNDNDPNGSNGIVTIKANNPSAGFCFASQIGFGKNSLWMGLDPGCGFAEVLHEWGHLLGLIHEQKRPDAPQHDPFVCSNLIDYPFFLTPAEADAQCCGAPQTCPPPANNPNNCCGLACQFTIECGDYNLQDPVGANGGTFDFDSIMLYRNDAFAKPGTFTLTKGPNAHTNPQKLSSEDINRVRELYGCPKPQCPTGCNPAVGANTCSFPTAQDCIYPSPFTPNPRAACACRAGYKATAPGITDTDTTKQWRLPAPEGNFRVWVAEGVACDTLCDVSTGVNSCKEVIELPAECLHN